MNKFLVATAAALILSFSPAQAQTIDAAQKAEIEALVKEYILENPEVLIQSFENHRVKQEARLNEESSVAAKALIAELDNGAIPSTGAAKPDVQIVEFMDYNCGYCKRAFDELDTILKEDKKVKAYFIEMPILGPTSMEAAKWALAAHKQGKYFEYHSALMKHQGPKNDSILEAKAKELKLDIEKMKKDKESTEIQQELERNMTRANLMNITGTPGFIIGGEVVRGYLTLDQMKEAIAEARKK